MGLEFPLRPNSLKWYNQIVSTLRILLADDHAIVRAGISNTLKELADLEIVGEVGDGPGLFAALA